MMSKGRFRTKARELLIHPPVQAKVIENPMML
jgi:hypothetical protein